MTGRPVDPAAPSVLLCGRYRLEHHLASGGMGEVWRGTDVSLNRPVAVKLLHDHLGSDPDLVDRFRREARAAARLSHPGIVAVYDTCSDGGRQAIVLQLVEGPTLRTYLDRVGVLSDAQTVTVGVAVADALAAAHDAGIVHRDVKPANILLGPERAMVTDFGVAKALDETDHTATGSMLGSVRYLAPEQVRGDTPDPRSDLFGLGVVLYECLSGSVPWDAGTPAATALARLDTPPRPLPAAVPPALAAVVFQCLAVDPAARPPDARSLADALRAALAAPATPPASARPADDLPAWGRDVSSPDATEWAAGAPTGASGHDQPGAPTDRSDGGDGVPPPWDGRQDAPWEETQGETWGETWEDEAAPWTGLGRRGCAGPVALVILIVTAIAVIVALLGGFDPGQLPGGG
jgi:serine/threonine protein kinase